MEVVKHVAISSALGLMMATGAAVGIFCATLGMTAICLLGAG